MTSYNNFIGIDIGKFNFYVAIHGNKNTKEYENNSPGINSFIKDYKENLTNSLSILETTGGHEMELLLTLCDKNFIVHRANTRKVKSFIRSYGNEAKTDILDAKALALYGHERSATLEAFTPQSKKALELYALVGRRQDLKQMLVAETNRSKSPLAKIVSKSCATIIDAISTEINNIDLEISNLIKTDTTLKAKQDILETIPGIGPIISSQLLICVPELGSLDRRQIASLTGLAPRANDSGKHKGYRRTGNGRNGIKPMLFMAAMAARNSKSELKVFYDNLIKRGKKKMVALVALMRKIIVIANARLKAADLETNLKAA